MATGGGEVPGQTSTSPADGADSEDLGAVKCQPCLEVGDLHEVAGMCRDCDEYLCRACFKTHRMPKPSRHHELIDREQMMQGNIRASTRDTCAEKCPDHDDDVIKYYCVTHGLLGCNVCITLDHTMCDGVQYIPKVAKDLGSNDGYTKTERRLKATLDTFKTLSDNLEKSSAELEVSCIEALKSIREFRKQMDTVLGDMEAKIIKKVQEFKSEEFKKLAAIGARNKATLEDLQSSLATIEEFQNAHQNCSSYIEMMRTKDKLSALDSEINEANHDASNMKRRITFVPNQELLDTLKQVDTFGALSQSGILSNSKVLSGSKRENIVGAKHVQDINVKIGTDTGPCQITGIAVLPGERLVLTDNNNGSIKMVSVQNGQVLTHLKLTSSPLDITVISDNKMAVTIPAQRKIAMVTVGDNTISIDRYLDVSGRCYGVDYRNGKLAVTYCFPDKVQVLNMQGAVLCDISAAPLHAPEYLTFGKDDDTLYVSNYSGQNVVCMKLDGTVVATYTDSKLREPVQPVMDSNGDIYVCDWKSHTVHQITKDCKKLRVLLSQTDGLNYPHSICLNDKKDRMYVGMWNKDIVKVYKIERAGQ